MQTNCGHLSLRSDGIICDECGFLSCIRCIQPRNLCKSCKVCNDEFSTNAMKLLLDPNCKHCPKCNKLCRCLGAKRMEKETWSDYLSRCFCMCVSCYMSANGKYCDNSQETRQVLTSYHITKHHCRNCNLDFEKETDKLITSYDTIHVKPKS